MPPNNLPDSKLEQPAIEGCTAPKNFELEVRTSANEGVLNHDNSSIYSERAVPKTLPDISCPLSGLEPANSLIVPNLQPSSTKQSAHACSSDPTSPAYQLHSTSNAASNLNLISQPVASASKGLAMVAAAATTAASSAATAAELAAEQLPCNSHSSSTTAEALAQGIVPVGRESEWNPSPSFSDLQAVYDAAIEWVSLCSTLFI